MHCSARDRTQKAQSKVIEIVLLHVIITGSVVRADFFVPLFPSRDT